MITLTAAISIPNVTRVEVLSVDFDEDNSVATVRIVARSPPGPNLVSPVVNIAVQNGAATAVTASQKVARAAAPAGLEFALVVVPQVNIPNGFANLLAAWFGAANKAARRRAAETQGLADGWIDASLAGAVA